jgi:hypothetical protein
LQAAVRADGDEEETTELRGGLEGGKEAAFSVLQVRACPLH